MGYNSDTMLFGLPLWFGVAFMFLFGAIIGSFLDVVIMRFHTGRSLNGRSHCSSCGQTLAWYELFPLLSYLFLRGRCRVCHAKIPTRLFWMEVVTGLLFASVWVVSQTLSELIFGLLFVALAIIITVYDVKHLVIPNVFVAAMFVLSVSSLMERVGMTSPKVYLFFLASGLLASSFYASLWLISKGRWIGLGDAKLALPLGTMLTVQETFSFVVLSFWVGAFISLTLLALQWLYKRGQQYLRFFDIPLTMRSEVPFAPFLLLAFALVYFFGADVLTIFFVTL